MKYFSTEFKSIKAQVAKDFADDSWPAAKVWLRAVGLPRLIAENVAFAADSLFRDINLSIHRNDPELRDLLVKAREAAREYATALAQKDWADFCEADTKKQPPRSALANGEPDER